MRSDLPPKAPEIALLVTLVKRFSNVPSPSQHELQPVKTGARAYSERDAAAAKTSRRRWPRRPAASRRVFACASEGQRKQNE
eukprot:5033317-Pleurochrysis_carterae.AAC.1